MQFCDTLLGVKNMKVAWVYEDSIVPVPGDFMSRKETCKPIIAVLCEKCFIEVKEF